MKHPASVLPFILLLGAVLPGCQGPSDSSGGQKPDAGTPVVASVAIQQEIEDYSDFNGTVSASELVEVRARVEGFLLSVSEYTREIAAMKKKADEAGQPFNWTSPDRLPIEVQDDFEVRHEDGTGGAGTVVEKGSLLFVIDPEPFEVSLEAAQAKVTGSKARLNLAEENLKRYDQLLRQEAVTVEEYQRNKASRDVALATVLTDQAAIREAEINLSYTIMRAPFKGRVDRRYVDPGNLVGSQDKTLLTTIRKEDPMQVYFDVSEKVILELLEWRRQNAGNPRNRYEVLLKLSNETEFSHKGYLDYLENRVDPDTGTALIRGEFPNEKGFLYDGLNVMVRVPGQPIPDAVLVHESAIGTDLAGKYVVTIEAGDEGKEVAKFRHVEMGLLHDEMREVRGIKPGQKYVFEGVQQVRDGTPVSITETVDLSQQPSPNAEQPPEQQPVPEAPAPTPSAATN
jgi:RND family efflux transporter MFP subunit